MSAILQIIALAPRLLEAIGPKSSAGGRFEVIMKGVPFISFPGVALRRLKETS